MKVKVYVDGSFNEQRKTYGGGVVIVGLPNVDQPLTSKVVGNEKALLSHRNIAGEVLSVIRAFVILDKIPDITEVEVCHDYMGIQHWITGTWQAKKPVSMAYKEAMKPYLEKFKITFTHVKAHSGDYYNNLADSLARDATFLEVGGNSSNA